MTKRPLVSRATDRCSALQANATFATGCTAPIHPDLASRTPARFTQPPRDKQANPTPDGFVQVMRRHTVSNCATIVYKIAVDRQRRTSVGGRRYLSGPHLRACQQQAPLLWHPYALASQHWCGVPPTGRHTMFTHHPDPTPSSPHSPHAAESTSHRTRSHTRSGPHFCLRAHRRARAQAQSQSQSQSTSTSASKVEARSPSAAKKQASANVDLCERNADHTGN